MLANLLVQTTDEAAAIVDQSADREVVQRSKLIPPFLELTYRSEFSRLMALRTPTHARVCLLGAHCDYSQFIG